MELVSTEGWTARWGTSSHNESTETFSVPLPGRSQGLDESVCLIQFNDGHELQLTIQSMDDGCELTGLQILPDGITLCILSKGRLILGDPTNVKTFITVGRSVFKNQYLLDQGRFVLFISRSEIVMVRSYQEIYICEYDTAYIESVIESNRLFYIKYFDRTGEMNSLTVNLDSGVFVQSQKYY